MKHFLLLYDVGEEFRSRREVHRRAHLEHAWAAHAAGSLVLAGAVSDPVDGAVLLFAADSPAVAEDFAKRDPYVVNGLVKRFWVREWATVVGAGAANPMRPEDP